ncbi:MAG: xanthine dehydrogenase accessory factor [Frankiaceae bacterium]|nr:xanthine dehydrogenase accessory factor [Frankiaceae bacterium]
MSQPIDVPTDPACAEATGRLPVAHDDRHLVAVFDSPVAAELAHFARHLGYAVTVLDAVSDVDSAGITTRTDVVVTDHDRPELGDVLAAVLRTDARWIGVMGSPRHAPPHVPALRGLGVDEADIARVHRPIGLDIGSRAPAEIAVATLAGLLADRNGRSGGFYSARPSN